MDFSFPSLTFTEFDVKLYINHRWWKFWSGLTIFLRISERWRTTWPVKMVKMPCKMSLTLICLFIVELLSDYD